ncbi:MAG: NAD(P)/FAD-dependent oxidoreductase [Acidobacteria bacterium]|nr:NAD(P)/FAD-dependent oxidoreductase [Acidobacteriota bacterium]
MARPFSVIRGDPARRYDAVVIGAGIGGLTCAALLARAGLRVLLVEQHYMVGGYCSTFRRGGFTFDAATHFYPLLGNPRTMSGRLLSELGVEVDWIKMDPVDRFHLPDGWTFDVPADFETYRRRLVVAFPLEAGAIDAFFALVRRTYLAGILHYFRRGGPLRCADLCQRPIRDVVHEHFCDRRLKLLLMADCAHWGSPPSRTSFVFDSMLRLAYFLGNYYPRGGSQRFVDALASRFEALGGDILLGRRVTAIAVDGNVARGVEVETGTARARRRMRVHADVVVSNADLRQTCEQLVGPEHFDQAFLTTLRSLRPTMPSFLTYLGVRGFTRDELEALHGYYWRSWDADDVARDGFMFKLFVPTLYERGMAPPGCDVIIVQKLVDVDYASTSDWAGHKAAVEARIMADLERLVPDIASRIVVKLSATAHTCWRYTLNHFGAMLGWEMSPDQLGDTRPDTTAPVDNLHFVGHWVRPGGGITPVIMSAIQVAADVIASVRPTLAPGGPPVRAYAPIVAAQTGSRSWATTAAGSDDAA